MVNTAQGVAFQGSERADAPSIVRACGIFRHQLLAVRYGFTELVNVQSAGGALFHFFVMEELRGDSPISMFEFVRRLLDVQREEVQKFISDNSILFSSKSTKKILAKLTPSPREESRLILSRKEFDSELRKADISLDSDFAKTLWAMYSFDIKILERGDFGFGLEPVAMPLLGETLKLLHNAGVGIVQIFDKQNDLRAIFRACDEAIDAGIDIQLELHYDPEFPGGPEGYAAMVRQIFSKYKCIRILGVKDAPGSLKSVDAYYLARALKEALDDIGISIPISLHTHDTGSRLGSIIEFERGLMGHSLIVDHCTSRGFLAQPNLFKTLAFLNQGIPLESKRSLQLVEGILRTELRERKTQDMPTEERKELVEYVQAGGSNGTLNRDITKNMLAVCDGLQISNDQASSAALFLAVKTQTRKFLPLVNRSIGCISRVTPGMNWLQAQALILLMFLGRKKELVYDSRNSQIFFEGDATNHLTSCLSPPFKNHIVLLLQDEELRKLVNEIDPGLLRAGFDELDSALKGLEGYDSDVAEAEFQEYGYFSKDSNVLDFLNPLLKVLKKDFVDRLVIDIIVKLKKSTDPEIEKVLNNRFEGINQDIIWNKGVIPEMSQELIMDLETLHQKYTARYGELEWETFVIMANFRGVMAQYYLKYRNHHLQAVSKDRSNQRSRNALKNMGIYLENEAA